MPVVDPVAPPRRAWAATRLIDFDSHALLRDLAVRAPDAGYGPLISDQMRAWALELEYLGEVVHELLAREPATRDWTLLFEYEIPRRQRRVDKVLLAGGVIVVMEFKIGATRFDRSAVWQAEDYALDLRDFHAESQGRPIVAFVVATGVDTPPTGADAPFAPGVQHVGRRGLASRILEVVARYADSEPPSIAPEAWDASAYRPTPTIIEAAQRLFAGHTVRDLSHAYADNLRGTVNAVSEAIEFARVHRERVICFVTGVPGAGKTLAGLVAVHDPDVARGGDDRAAFLSGNGPLVRVLREALIRDATSRGMERRSAEHRAKLLIQNVHMFVEEYGVRDAASSPPERVIVFDEAQRAWDARKLRKRHRALAISEPALVLQAMGRVPDWCVVVALVGGGQEIHSGEAGLEEWGRALAGSEHRWRVKVADDILRGGPAVAGHCLFDGPAPDSVRLDLDQRMHLGVSVRSPRALRIAEWVNAVLALKPTAARAAVSGLRNFRLGLTRELEDARRWLRDAGREDRRAGLLASSGSMRHRAYGLEMAPEFHRAYPIAAWFLGAQDDVRSSHALEVAMREFECQGLELDYVGLCWGDDLTIRATDAEWSMREFRGAAWRNVTEARKREYLVNKYRVLMTRAREGLVIWVPRGDTRDPTRDPKRLDRTAEYLLDCGLTEVD